MRTYLRLVIAVTIALFMISREAHAQVQGLSPPPLRQLVDENGIDLISRVIRPSTPSISIGRPNDGGLTFYRTWDSSENFWRDNLSGGCYQTGAGFGHYYELWWLGGRMRFHQYPVITSDEHPGATFNGVDVLTTEDGTIVEFDGNYGSYLPTVANCGRVSRITYPTGEVLTFAYTTIAHVDGQVVRLQSVRNNFGYQIQLEYASNSITDYGSVRLTKATAFNLAVDYCSPTANSCSFTQAWPSLTFGYSNSPASAGGTPGDISTMTVTDALSRVWTYEMNGGYYEITSPEGVVTRYNGSPAISFVRNGSLTWTYDVDSVGSNLRTTVTSPLGKTRRVVYNPSIDDVLVSDQDELGNTTTFQHATTTNFLTRVTYPEGNYVSLSYDGRGNITERRAVSKTSGTPADIVETADYDISCSNPITCNRPNSITDARGYRTDYTYDSTHGGVLTETRPAPSGSTPVGSGTRPQTRYTYGSGPLYAWYHTSSSTISQASAPVYRLTQVSQCQTSSSCANGSDEVRTTTTYQSGSSSVASNLLPLTVTVGAGDGSLSATTTTDYTYDGDVASVDGPRSDVSDVVTYRYDVMRQRVGEIEPDPDGSGTLLHNPAIKTTYDDDGRVSLVERGTVNGTSDTDWSGFTTLQGAATAYDSFGRKSRESASIGGVTQSLTQYAYDDDQRLDCVAVRMNPAIYGSLPSSACTLGTAGSNGPDRITHNTYDDAGHVLTVVEAYGVTTGNGFASTVQRTARTNAWTANGKLDYVEDANGNRSDYTYDGFDRLIKLNFPSTTVGAHSANSSDYEEYGYDANNNRTSLRLRSSETINYTYDNLNRETLKDIPGGSSTDVYSSYDLLGRRLYARFSSTSGNGITYAYDALARLTSETETFNSRALSFQYDLAGNRTRLTFPDSNYVDYTYDVLNRMKEVRENGSTSGAGLLGVYAYDDLGRRTSLAFGNGSANTFSYDTDSQDWSLAQDFASTGQDVTFSFTRSPATQTLTRSSTNSAFAYAAPALSQSYTPNGLNQYTAVGGATFTSDARGNLTSDGTARAFCYDYENHLTAVAGVSDTACSAPTVSMSYDPLGRLRTTTASSTTTTYLYDGDRLVAEYNGSTLLRRYVHGAGVDTPIVWYEGSGLTTRNWLHGNEQGSIIATSNGSAAATVYSYGAYGEPDSTNGWSGSRFRYTGQIMLPEAHLYHYKARVYDPGLGRFLQTDPVGYQDDLDLYAYVRNDPLNLADPMGQCGSNQQDQQSAQDHCTGAWYAATSPASPGQAGSARDGELAIQDHYAGKSGSPYTVDPQTMKMDRALDIGTQIQASINNPHGVMSGVYNQAFQSPGTPVSFNFGTKTFTPSLTGEAGPAGRSVGRFSGNVTGALVVDRAGGWVAKGSVTINSDRYSWDLDGSSFGANAAIAGGAILPHRAANGQVHPNYEGTPMTLNYNRAYSYYAWGP